MRVLPPACKSAAGSPEGWLEAPGAVKGALECHSKHAGEEGSLLPTSAPQDSDVEGRRPRFPSLLALKSAQQPESWEKYILSSCFLPTEVQVLACSNQ